MTLSNLCSKNRLRPLAIWHYIHDNRCLYARSTTEIPGSMCMKLLLLAGSQRRHQNLIRQLRLNLQNMVLTLLELHL